MILEIATRIFSHYGYAKTSLDVVAAEAHIAKGTIYYYFSNKEELYMQVVEEQTKIFVQDLRKAIQDTKGFEDKLRVLIRTPVKYTLDKMQVWMEGLKNIPFSFQKHLASYRDERRIAMIEIIQEILEVGKLEGKLPDNTPIQKLSVAINDWFLLGNKSIIVIDFETLLSKLDEDLDIIIDLILYGIVKRG